jgi:hypothetical protein
MSSKCRWNNSSWMLTKRKEWTLAIHFISIWNKLQQSFTNKCPWGEHMSMKFWESSCSHQDLFVSTKVCTQYDVLLHLLGFSHQSSWKAHSTLTFKQDWATPHISEVILNFLSNYFHDSLFSDILGKLEFHSCGHSTLWTLTAMCISYDYSWRAVKK